MKENLDSLKSFISTKFRWKAFFGFASGVALAITALGINVQGHVVYKVYVNDTAIGYIKSLEEYEMVRDSIVETDGTEPLQQIKIVTSNEYWRNTADGIKEDEQQLEARGEQTHKDQEVASAKALKQAMASTRIDVSPSNEETDEAYTYEDYLIAKEEMEYAILTTAINTEDESATQAMAMANSNGAKTTEDGYISSAWLEDYVRKTLDLRVNAVALYADDEQIAVLESQQEANTVMQKIKEYYYPQSGKYTVLSCEIKENITTSSVMAYKDEIMDTYDTVQRIVDGKGVKKVYEVQKGDTLWDIALENGISLEELQVANEGIDINKLHIGDKINLAVIEPYVTVTVVADVTAKEVISYETKKIQDKTLKAGTNVVKQEGQNGVAEVQAKVTLVNGNVVTEEVLNRTVITEPVTRIVNVGAYYVAAGTYIRPTGGIISSRYGWRSRGWHSGVDFASTRGTPIKAANTGKVICAAWRGNYGQCIIIDHGNGVQTLYGHCSNMYVSVGDYVSKGQTIGAVGSTGRSTGPHVHFEVKVNGKTVNPFNYIN